MFEFRANFVDSYWLNLNKNWKIIENEKNELFFFTRFIKKFVF